MSTGVTGVDVEHTKALTDAEIDADLVGDGGMYYDPDASYPEYGNGTVRWAYRLGHEAGGAALPSLSSESKHCTRRYAAAKNSASAAHARTTRSARHAHCTGPAPPDKHWRHHERSILPLLLNN